MTTNLTILRLLPFWLFLLATEGNLSADPSLSAAPALVITGNFFTYGGIYLLAGLLLGLPSGNEARSYLGKTGLPLLLLLLVVPLSLAWTVSPLSVAKEEIHFLGVILIGAVSAAAFRHNSLLFFSGLHYFSFCMAGLSVVAALLLPQLGLGINGRWQGVTVHPNHLGIVAMVGTYAAVSLCFLRADSFWRKSFDFLSIFLFLFCLLKANSVTSILITLFLLTTIPAVIIIIRSCRPAAAVIKVSAICITIMMAVLLAYLAKPELFKPATFFAVTGRNQTLTGRLNLWHDGWLAFLKRPWLGWGFDNLQTLSLSAPFKITYLQFHNGYLDLLVRGGWLTALLFAGFLFATFTRLLKILRYNKEHAVLLVLLLFAILAHNITEASLMQFPNSLWFLMVCLHFHSLTYPARQENKAVAGGC